MRKGFGRSTVNRAMVRPRIVNEPRTKNGESDVYRTDPFTTSFVPVMCGRVIQSSGPLRYAIVDGLNVRDSRVHNYPPRWNGAPSQELLVIRRNHKTGEISLDRAARLAAIPAGENPANRGVQSLL